MFLSNTVNLPSRPEGCSWPRELWFLIYLCMYIEILNNTW